MDEGSKDGGNIEVPLAPVPAVIGFLNKVWHHPLLDEKTIEHRRLFQEYFKRWCEPWGINPDEVVAVLAGSSLWSANRFNPDNRINYGKGSDWDFILYGPDGIIKDFRQRKEHESIFNHHAEQKYYNWDIHPDEVYKESDLRELTALAPLLLTPDNFIAGNTKLAQRYRLKLVDLQDPDQKQLDHEFEYYMKGWPNIEYPESRTGDRKERFENALDKAAIRKAKRIGIPVVFKNDPFPTKFKELFTNAMKKIKTPSVRTYKEALRQTQGALVLPARIVNSPNRL